MAALSPVAPPLRGAADDLVVVDSGYYYPQQRDGRIDGIEGEMTESRWVEQQLGRTVVKAFNNIYAQHLMERGRPASTPGPRAATSLLGLAHAGCHWLWTSL
ncbi:MAG: hypothetical protein WKF75_19515 [Singulisphaera sp.]